MIDHIIVIRKDLETGRAFHAHDCPCRGKVDWRQFEFALRDPITEFATVSTQVGVQEGLLKLVCNDSMCKGKIEPGDIFRESIPPEDGVPYQWIHEACYKMTLL